MFSTIATKVQGAVSKKVWFVSTGKEGALAELMDCFKQMGADRADFEEVSCGVESFNKALKLARTTPMIGEYRVVTIRYAGVFEQSKWVKALSGIPEFSRVVIVLAKTPRKVIKGLLNIAAIVPSITADDLIVALRASLNGQRITNDAARILVARFPSKDRLVAEIYKLTSVCSKAMITGSDLFYVAEHETIHRTLKALSRNRDGIVVREAFVWYEEGRIDEFTSLLANLVCDYLRIQWAGLGIVDIVRLMKVSPERAVELKKGAEEFQLNKLRGWLKVLSGSAMHRSAPLDTILNLVGRNAAFVRV